MYDTIENIIERKFKAKEFTVIEVDYIFSDEVTTVSTLKIDGKFISFVIEDVGRKIKEYGKTRIGQGLYECVQNRTFGFYARYNKNYGHEFIVHITNVDNFKYILFHIGNTAKDTAGCLLLNSGVIKRKPITGYSSKVAYFEFYEAMVKAFNKGRVFVNINRSEKKNILF